VWIRQVLVPGITDDDESLRRTAGFVKSLSNVRRVEVLPYHTLGVYKWDELGIPYTLRDVQPPSAGQGGKRGADPRGERSASR
jgi:pyruvate formate lyase activating enzyme